MINATPDSARSIRAMSLPPAPHWMPSMASLRAAYRGVMRDPTYRLRLTEYVCRLLPPDGPVHLLDIGAGDGSMMRTLVGARPETSAIGVEVFLREVQMNGEVPLIAYDGLTLPFTDRSCDVAMLINVLHHAADPGRLLGEACRVTSRRIIIKDHVQENLFDWAQLALLDVAGNLRFGASATGNYLSGRQWASLVGGIPGWACHELASLPFRTGALASVFPNSLETIIVLDRIAD